MYLKSELALHRQRIANTSQTVCDLHQFMYRQKHVCCGRWDLFSDQWYQWPRQQIWRRRLDSNLRDHNGSSSLSYFLIFLNHFPDPWSFSGAVKIMRSILSACFECILSVCRIWANCGDKDRGFSSKIAKFGIIKIAYFDGYIMNVNRFRDSRSGQYNWQGYKLKTRFKKWSSSRTTSFLPGWIRSGFEDLQVAAIDSSFDSDRPAIAHLILVGRLAAM